MYCSICNIPSGYDDVEMEPASVGPDAACCTHCWSDLRPDQRQKWLDFVDVERQIVSLTHEDSVHAVTKPEELRLYIPKDDGWFGMDPHRRNSLGARARRMLRRLGLIRP